MDDCFLRFFSLCLAADREGDRRQPRIITRKIQVQPKGYVVAAVLACSTTLFFLFFFSLSNARGRGVMTRSTRKRDSRDRNERREGGHVRGKYIIMWRRATSVYNLYPRLRNDVIITTPRAPISQFILHFATKLTIAKESRANLCFLACERARESLIGVNRH